MSAQKVINFNRLTNYIDQVFVDSEFTVYY